MTDIKSDEDEVLLTCKRQKTKKIAIDSDAEDDFSNLLAKPTKQEKEPLERKDYIHNSAKKSSKPISTKEKTTNSLENNNPLGENVVLKEEKNVSNGEKEHLAKEKDHKEHISKEKEHISKEKDSHQKEKDHSMKEKTISKEKDHLNKEKEGNLHKEKENHEKEKNKTISHVKNNEPIKTGESKEKTKVKLENKTPMKTKNSPKPKKFREPDSENSLFDPGTSSDEDRRKIKIKSKSTSSHTNNHPQPKKVEKKPSDAAKNPTKSKETKSGSGLQPKDSIIRGILRRWWYCMEDWPPVDYDYAAKLLENNLRLVKLEKWKSEPELDESGLEKVCEFQGFPGIFRNSKRAMLDLRPKESCPCFDSLKKKSIEELMSLYKTALINQLAALEGFKDYESPELIAEIKKELNKVQKQNP